MISKTWNQKAKSKKSTSIWTEYIKLLNDLKISTDMKLENLNKDLKTDQDKLNNLDK